jgi:hypothetical protein
VEGQNNFCPGGHYVGVVEVKIIYEYVKIIGDGNVHNKYVYVNNI